MLIASSVQNNKGTLIEVYMMTVIAKTSNGNKRKKTSCDYGSCNVDSDNECMQM